LLLNTLVAEDQALVLLLELLNDFLLLSDQRVFLKTQLFVFDGRGFRSLALPAFD